MLDRIADDATELSMCVDVHRFVNAIAVWLSDQLTGIHRRGGDIPLSHGMPPYEMVIPPSIGKVPPVTQAASSEAR